MTTHEARAVTLPARPEPVHIDLARTALVVVDMQNAFMSPGRHVRRGRLADRGAQAVIGPSAPAARRRCAPPASPSST